MHFGKDLQIAKLIKNKFFLIIFLQEINHFQQSGIIRLVRTGALCQNEVLP